MMHYESCPLCSSPQISEYLAAKDYTVSQKKFSIYKCTGCTGAFTQDVPALEEIGQYYASENYISHSDTQAGLVNALYHQVRKKTLRSKLQLINKITGLQTGELLDIGCGTGAFLHTMLQGGWKVTGLEPDATARENAEKLYGLKALPSGELLNLPEKKYHAITMWHVLEHVHQLHDYIIQSKKLLSDNGVLVIAVPNYTSKDAEQYGAYWAAYDVPRHLYHFSPGSMKLLMERHGMAVAGIKPMWYDSFYVSMLSEKYKNGGGNIVSAFVSGLSSNLKAMKETDRCSSLIYIIRKK